MSKKSTPKIFILRPGRALAILDYLTYLDRDGICNEIEAKKDGITHIEWMYSQMWIKSKLSKKLPSIREELLKRIKSFKTNQLTLGLLIT